MDGWKGKPVHREREREGGEIIQIYKKKSSVLNLKEGEDMQHLYTLDVVEEWKTPL